MNTDGVNLYSSSKVELWPIFLAINELSPSLRFARENLIIAGLWQGKGKPPFKLYFSTFATEIKSLFTEGIDINISPVNGNVKLAVVCSTMDLPAKAGVLNMTQFNGQEACITCEEPGKVVASGRGHARNYPYRKKSDKFPLRTNAQVKDAMSRASEKNRIKGIKGESGLAKLDAFDLVDGIVPDYMHCVLLGATKNLMHNWFSPTQSGCDYFIGKHLKTISNRLKNIKPPDIIERLPRDLEKHYNHFKATELQTWLLYYCIPCLINILPEKYLAHFALLSEGIHILLGDSISPESLSRAKSLLQEFYSTYSTLYPNTHCGLNIHNIGEHIVNYVEKWGPLWAWSCFPFEDSNAMLLQSVHGTGLVTKQVLRQKAAQTALRSSLQRKPKGKSWRISMSTENCDLAGGLIPIQKHLLEETIRNKIEQCQLGDVLTGKRIIKDGHKFFSQAYTRVEKRVCHIVLLRNGDIGAVKYFIYSQKCNRVFVVLSVMKICQELKVQMRGGKHIHMTEHMPDHLDLVPAEELEETLVYIKTGPQENGYVIAPPNKLGRTIFK